MLPCLGYNLALVFKSEINSRITQENTMYDNAELKERLVIIKNSNLDDASILDENYMQLIRETPNPEEQQQLVILHSNVQRRIKQLTGINGRG